MSNSSLGNSLQIAVIYEDIFKSGVSVTILLMTVRPKFKLERKYGLITQFVSSIKGFDNEKETTPYLEQWLFQQVKL